MNSGRSSNGISGYEARVASEIEIYRECVDVHDLPPIFHYWSNRYLRPRLQKHGFTDPAGMFLRALEHQCATHAGETVRILSVGSGNCDLEIGIATGLRAKGYEHFTIECLDLNPAMLKRGAALARQQGVQEHLEFVEADLNRWVAQREYQAAMADQSLHHMMELESLFGQIRQSLRPDGIFVISDMVGRNGHLRWPEALAIVHEFWRKLPPSYRQNCRSGRYEAFFEDADCSTESFEGIRAQDILPLLEEYFHFQFYLGFGNVIDPFVDRSFGPNFDPAEAWDREFIDQVHRRDEAEIAAGRLQPTHMLAVLGKQPGATSVFGVSAPRRVAVSASESWAAITEPPKSGYDWGAWPHSAEAQLETACRIMEDSENRIKALEKELARTIAIVEQKEVEFQERTAWALQLDQQLREVEVASEEELLRREVWARKLEAELAARTEWALGLDSELAERTEWALHLDRELTALMHRSHWRQSRILGYLRHPLTIADRLLGGSVSQVRKLLG